jgi:hypothetical protein
LPSTILLYHIKPKCKNSFYEIANDDLILQNREARQSAPSGTNSPAKTHWAALCAARENLGKFPESQIIVRLYDLTRTYFIKNL